VSSWLRRGAALRDAVQERIGHTAKVVLLGLPTAAQLQEAQSTHDLTDVAYGTRQQTSWLCMMWWTLFGVILSWTWNRLLCKRRTPTMKNKASQTEEEDPTVIYVTPYGGSYHKDEKCHCMQQSRTKTPKLRCKVCS